jgi:tetratricopeptide (TPR) repeat protein
MKIYTIFVLLCLSLLAPSLFAQTSQTIPEEARRHFVKGSTLFKEAKTADDFSRVESEFKQAADLAPQWPEARYDLALSKEAAGDYAGAMADLKLYLGFKLSDTEARTVQDKIYVLEAKADVVAAKQKQDEQKAADNVQADADAKRKVFLKAIQGDWHANNGYVSLSIRPLENGDVKITLHIGRYLAVSAITITASTLQFTSEGTDNNAGNPEMITRYELSLDGSRLTGTWTDSLTESGKARIRQAGNTPGGDRTEKIDFVRQ